MFNSPIRNWFRVQQYIYFLGRIVYVFQPVLSFCLIMIPLSTLWILFAFHSNSIPSFVNNSASLTLYPPFDSVLNPIYKFHKPLWNGICVRPYPEHQYNSTAETKKEIHVTTRDHTLIRNRAFSFVFISRSLKYRRPSAIATVKMNR